MIANLYDGVAFEQEVGRGRCFFSAVLPMMDSK